MDLASADKLLTTTRSVRKRLDLTRPVSRELIDECLEIALQAPTGSNSQGWHFLVVSDPDKRREIAGYYRGALEAYMKMQESGEPRWGEGDPRAAQEDRIRESAIYLAQHLHEVPIHLIPCVEGRVEEAGAMAQASVYGSILPAAWSFMLAARARGLGSAWTTLHLMHEKEVAKLLEIPESFTQCALLPVAHYLGDDFRPAKRLPLSQVSSWDRFGHA